MCEKVLLQINSYMLQGLALALVACDGKSQFNRKLCSNHFNRKGTIFRRKPNPWDKDGFT